MAETTTAPSNKLVAFKGRAQKELMSVYKRGLISDAALRKEFAKMAGHKPPKPKHSQFAKMAGHNPPKPKHSQPNDDEYQVAGDVVRLPITKGTYEWNKFKALNDPPTGSPAQVLPMKPPKPLSVAPSSTS